MAPWTANPTFDVVYTFEDNNGAVSACSVQFAGTILYTDVLLAAGAFGTVLEGISDASLKGYQVTRRFSNDAPIAAPKTSEVARKLRVPLGTLQFENSTYLEVPSPKFEIEIDGTDVVDPANALVVALIEAIEEEDGPLGTADLSTYYGAEITRVGNMFITHRNRKPNA